MRARACASRSFRLIIILFANASATRPYPGLLNFRVGLDYASFVRALPVAVVLDGWRIYGGCFPVFFNTPPFRGAFRRPISNMPIVHTSSIARGSYGFVRSAARDKEQYSSTWPRYRRTCHSRFLSFSRLVSADNSTSPKQTVRRSALCFIIEAFREPEQIGSPKF